MWDLWWTSVPPAKHSTDCSTRTVLHQGASSGLSLTARETTGQLIDCVVTAMTNSVSRKTRRTCHVTKQRVFFWHDPCRRGGGGADRLWGPPNRVFSAYGGLSPPVGGEVSRGASLTTHLQLVPRTRKVELYLHSPLRLNGIVLNQLSTGTTLP
jgi:hypothetical protein